VEKNLPKFTILAGWEYRRSFQRTPFITENEVFKTHMEIQQIPKNTKNLRVGSRRGSSYVSPCPPNLFTVWLRSAAQLR
tara:strand:+ start:1721 stop:1957 length:237 start_codon:yes stop_codon:yes gene_type:complete